MHKETRKLKNIFPPVPKLAWERMFKLLLCSKKKITRVLFESVFLFILFICNVFSQQPSISVNNIQWHSFNMNMGNYSDNVISTRWLITQSPYGEGDTVLDTRWNECNINIADRRNLFSKLITGCIPEQEYKACVSYFNGAWSQFSNAVTFNIPDAPALTGNDTIHVVLWGHSFIDYGDQCGQITNIFCGEDYPDAPYDLIGHVMKTELRKLTGKKIAVINRGVAGSLQHDWYRDYHLLYEPGGIYSDNSKYPVAIFFFGTNDAHGEVDANQYGDDMRKIINFLLSRGVKVITNSIHYANDHEHEFDIPFFYQWNTVMSEFANNPNNRKGLDLLHLIKADTVRFMAGDEAHPNRSEGLPLVAHMIDSLLLLSSSWVSTNNINDAAPKKLTSMQNISNSFSQTAKIQFEVTKKEDGIQNSEVKLKIYGITGREIRTLVNESLNPGKYEVTFDVNNLPSGIYLYQLKINNPEYSGQVLFETKEILILN